VKVGDGAGVVMGIRATDLGIRGALGVNELE